MEFYKYQGTGNDFICIDNRLYRKVFTIDDIEYICSRKFGIGSDGLILIENHPDLDFIMIFYNPDGSQSFCGNGSRCAVLFAYHLGIIEKNAHFLSTDGEHKAVINFSDKGAEIALDMHNVNHWEKNGNNLVMNTGSPHYVQFGDAGFSDKFTSIAHSIRYSDTFKKQGINVNFVRKKGNSLVEMRTYERGVENETLSCGTGVTAAALSLAIQENMQPGDHSIAVNTKGGKLRVSFNMNNGFTNVKLIGPAQKVFSGNIEL